MIQNPLSIFFQGTQVYANFQVSLQKSVVPAARYRVGGNDC